MMQWTLSGTRKIKNNEVEQRHRLDENESRKATASDRQQI